MLYTLCIVAHGLVTHNEKYIGMSTGHKIAVSQKKVVKKLNNKMLHLVDTEQKIFV